MFDAFRDFFGNPYVEEKDKVIVIGGINTELLFADINKIWGNLRVVKHIFHKTRNHSVIFYKFFAIDVLYILEQVTLFKKRRSSKYRISRVIDELQEKTWLKRLSVEYPPILDKSQLTKLTYTPLPHQVPFFDMYESKTQRMGLNGFLLAAGVGSGKSYMSLALSACLHVDVAILISPKSLAKSVWEDELIRQFGPDVRYWVSTSNQPIATYYKYYVCHYDALEKLDELVSFLKNKKTIVVLDESHNFNDDKSLRSRRFVSFCRRIDCHNVVFSSGTPVKAMGMEMITLLQCIDPLFIPEVEESFRKIFGISSKRAVDILRHRLDLISYKIPRQEYMEKVPSPIVKQLRVRIPDGNLYTVDNVKQEMKDFMDAQWKFYTANMKKYIAIYDECINIYRKTIRTSKDQQDLKLYLEYIAVIRKYYDPENQKEILQYCNLFEKQKIAPSLPTPAMRKAFKDAKTVVKYVQLKVLGEALGRVLGKRRSECHAKMVEHSGAIDIVLNADKKTLCFTSFVEVVETADKYFKKHGLQPTLVYGGNPNDVSKTITDFKEDPNINPIIATLQSMSAGVTLINCSVCIFFDTPFRSYIHEQGSARLYRIGQDCQVYIYEFVLDTGDVYNISERASDIMAWSKQQVEEIIGKGVSDNEMAGIVKRLNLNPPSQFERAINKFKDLFNI